VYTEADDLKTLAGLHKDIHEADNALLDGNYDRAISLLTGVIGQRPDTADAITGLARAYWATGDAAAAITVLDNAMRAGVTTDDIRLRLGLYLAESRTDVPRAIEILRTLPDDDMEGLNALGVAYGAAERWNDAIAAFQRILAVDAGNALAMQNIAAMYLSDDNLTSAEQFARRAIDRDPQLAKAHTTLGVVFARSRRLDQAAASWTRAVELDPTEFDAMYNLVILLAESGRIGEARRYAQQFVNTAPRAAFAREVEQLSALLR
jgi:tetratricopeptide (TPR) repeat protein